MKINYFSIFVLIIFILSIYLSYKYIKNKYIVFVACLVFAFFIVTIFYPTMHLLLIQPSKYELKQGTNHISINLIRGLYRITIYEDGKFYNDGTINFHTRGYIESDIKKELVLPTENEKSIKNYLEFRVDKIFKRVQIDFLLSYEADMTNKMYLLCQPRK